MKNLIILVGILSVICMCQDAFASIDVDGNLTDDWGITPRGFSNGNDLSDWTPSNGAIGKVENQKGGLGAFLGPGYGGQLFDAEGLFYKRENGMIYLALVTGLPYGGALDSRGTRYYPGDIAIDFNGDDIYEYGIETTDTNKGRLYKGLNASSWNHGLPNWGGSSDPTTMIDGAGTPSGLPFEFAYNNTYYWINGSTNYNKHYVMEMGIPEDYFGYDWMNGGTIHWTQTCGNDAIDLDIPASTPEPSTLLLLGLGLGAGLRGRFRKIGKGKGKDAGLVVG